MEGNMSLRPTHYPDLHDEFYFPAGLSPRERKPIRKVGYEMGVRGQRVSREFLDDQAHIYHGRLNAATHTIDQRADIARKRASDPLRNVTLLALAIGGMIIVVLALTVDFKILEDFWTTIYQNKFLQVPESLKDNVIFKSLQVLFAVLAIHFLISAPGVAGKVIRGAFVTSIGFMVVLMLVGLGFLAANSTLPAGATLKNHPVHPTEAAVHQSNTDVLTSLGLRPSSGTEVKADKPAKKGSKTSSKPAELRYLVSRGDKGGGFFSSLWHNAKNWDFATWNTVVFYSTFSLIFLFVSSVGALCMHYSLRSINALTGGVSPEHRESALPGGVLGVTYRVLGKGEWRSRTRKDLADERQRLAHAQRLIGDASYRGHLMDRFFAEFAAGYTEGLHDRDRSPRRFAGPDFDTLRGEMRTELAEARGDWSAAAIAERLPDVELRTSLGYDPDAGMPTGPFSYVANLVSGRGARDSGELVVEDRRRADTRAPLSRVPPPSADNERVVHMPQDGEAPAAGPDEKVA
jgi:hypothetical protein